MTTKLKPGYEEAIRLLKGTAMTQKSIAEMANVPMHIVHRLAQEYRTKEQRRRGIGRTAKTRKVTREWLIEHRYNKGMTLQEMGTLLGVTRERVRQLCAREGLTDKVALKQSYWRKEDVGEKVSVNKEYFDVIDSEEKAYWLGYLVAKGRIQALTHGRLVVTMNAAEKNVEHVYQLLTTLEAEVPLMERETTIDGQTFISYVASIRSHYLASRLKDLGLETARHDVTEVSEEIPEELVRHYFRGYYDGKGFVWQSPSRDSIRQFFLYGSTEFLEKFREIVSSAEGLYLESGYIYDKDPVHKNHRFSIVRRESVEGIWKYLYDGATIYQPRKLKQYEDIMGGGES